MSVVVPVLLTVGFVGFAILDERYRVASDELRRKADALSRLSSDVEEDDKAVINFLYTTILFRVRSILSLSKVDPFVFAKRLPRWIDEYSGGGSSEYRSIKPKSFEDDVARRIAEVTRLSSSFPYRVFIRHGSFAKSIVIRDIKLSVSDTDYLVIACSHLILSEILDSPNSSEDNARFFESLKKKWPAFTWSESDEIGFLEDDYL